MKKDGSNSGIKQELAFERIMMIMKVFSEKNIILTNSSVIIRGATTNVLHYISNRMTGS